MPLCWTFCYRVSSDSLIALTCSAALPQLVPSHEMEPYAGLTISEAALRRPSGTFSGLRGSGLFTKNSLGTVHSKLAYLSLKLGTVH